MGERPLYPKEKVLEQVLEWSTLEDPSSAFLVVKKFSGAKAANSQQESSTDFGKGEHFKFKDGSSKLLSGNKFQDRYVVLRDEKLLLYKDVKVSSPTSPFVSYFVSCEIWPVKGRNPK
ncbi:hypothetical protein Z043_107571 [Scleropages formosus]|uniref:Ras-associating domain-containing protein n=1 Tax=Scleropages formosus TaxID=113540 RepID=A0A0P7XDK0_SCLFO|nr:hypothetical protein Z043_107571 [Scleropages formosus]